MKLQVLLLDEVSMLDTDAWNAICTILSTVDHSRRPDVQTSDTFGSLHVILFGDFKQLSNRGETDCEPKLFRVGGRCWRMCVYGWGWGPPGVSESSNWFRPRPPATSLPPFIVNPDVYGAFDFRVLQQNRRIVAGTEDRAGELHNFHQVLNDISWGIDSDAVRDFIIDCYVRGAACGEAGKCDYDGSTAIFTKRR